MHVARHAIDDDGVTRIGDAGGVVDLANRGDSQGAGDDGRAAGPMERATRMAFSGKFSREGA